MSLKIDGGIRGWWFRNRREVLFNTYAAGLAFGMVVVGAMIVVVAMGL